MSTSTAEHAVSQSPWQIFLAFLTLGVSAFGGPVAHLGYFRTEFVDRRKWVDAEQFQDLIALCQFLPGPMSSQVGFAIGMLKGRIPGGLAAWLGFTAPSALLMIGLGVGTNLFDSGLPPSLVHGLKLAAVAIVAWALWQMARVSCRGGARIAFAAIACAVMLATDLVWIQIGVIALGAVAGRILLTPVDAVQPTADGIRFSRRFARVSAVILIVLLAGSPVAASLTGLAPVELFSSFFRVGSLVFGGGHVVLPLLQAEVVPPGWLDSDTFLAGYGAAQALPGPMFTLAGYLGAVAAPGGSVAGWMGGVIALIAIFLPSFLLLTAALPYWQTLRTRPSLRTALGGVNAAVVGLLLAVLIDPVWTSSVLGLYDLAIVAVGVALLASQRVPVWVIVIFSAGAGTIAA